MAEQGPQNRGSAGWIRQLALALDLPFVLLGAVMGGGVIGFLLDTWLHTTPWLMLAMGLLGFLGGMRSVLQSLARRGNTGAKGSG